jgi:hypothetical protein
MMSPMATVWNLFSTYVFYDMQLPDGHNLPHNRRVAALHQEHINWQRQGHHALVHA